MLIDIKIIINKFILKLTFMTTGPSKFLYLPPVRPVLALHLCFLLRRSAVEVLWWAKKLHNTELRKNARAILWVHQLRHWNQIPNAKEKKIPNFCLKNLSSRHWQLLQSDLWKSLRSCNSKPASSLIDLHLIFEKSSLKNLVDQLDFCLFRTWILQATQAVNKKSSADQ